MNTPHLARITWLALAAAFAIGGAPARAVTTNFETDPFAASPNVIPGDGIRQFGNGGTVFLPSFDVTTDQFGLLLSTFGLSGPLRFVNALATNLPPAAGANAIVLRDSVNPANGGPFNAGVAANVIADALTTDGAGFFVYFNTALNINRLVFSPNLNVATSDLAILAAIQSPTGAGAIAALPTFTNRNFAALAENLAPVPLPAALPMLGAALGLLGLARVRRNLRRA